MILAEPPPSQADLHFRFFDIPVRIHPFFWIIAVIFAIQGETPPAVVLNWVVAVFISILIHELGHAFLQRYYGGNPRIVLHGMGGLAICGDCDRSSKAQILISLAGPGAGLVFAVVIALLIRLSGHQLGFYSVNEDLPVNAAGLKLLGQWLLWEGYGSGHVNEMIQNLFFINIFWGFINLVPIYPLDGGQVCRELCMLRNPRNGIILSLQISLFSGIFMAILGILAWKSFFVGIMFGYLAYSSYKTLQAYRASLW